jgi:hypothetical protein
MSSQLSQVPKTIEQSQKQQPVSSKFKKHYERTKSFS